jgi:two-component system NarL family sensor kinase
MAANGSAEDALRAEIASLRAELDTCRQLVAQVLDAEDSARRRIAQLIHDDALQNLLAANQELMEAAPGRVQVQRAHEVVEGTIVRLREAMMTLHPVTLEQGGFETALGAVARQSARQGGFHIELEIDPQALDVADALLLAIARELLNNAARHAKAENVTVVLRRRGDELELEVADDGRGIGAGRREEALSQGHIGLASVHERVRSVNGSFAVESSSAGTRALARLPLADVVAVPAG